MRKMSDLTSIIREKNVKWGMWISALITTISYVIVSIISMVTGTLIYSGFVLFADLEFLLGSIFGVLNFFKNREPHQEFLKYGIIVGILGGVLACLFISFYQTILIMITIRGHVIIFFLYVGFTFLSGAVIGLLTGTFLAIYYMSKDTKEDNVEKEYLDDKFFDDLIDK